MSHKMNTDRLQQERDTVERVDLPISEKVESWQQPVYIGSVIVKPGDLIMADIDGALVVPRRMIVDVLERAEQIERNEGEIKEWVDAGLSAADIHERGGYF
jgi:4-hydroxy-4-methyl-2-oxoglutarate aldolase